MAITYYMKELPNTAIYLSNGAPFRFDYLATEDAWLTMELDAAISNGVGGVVKITKEQYEEGLKKKSEGKSRNNSPQYRQELASPNLNPFNMQARGFQGGRAAAVAGRPVNVPPGELPDPLKVPDPSEFVMPTVGKMP